MLLAHVDHRFRRHAERIGDQPDGVAERGLENFQRALSVERLRLVVIDAGLRQFDAVFFQEVAGECAVLVRNSRFQAFPGDVLLARGGDVLRDQHVEPIGLAIDVIVDPFQLLLDGFGRMRRRSKYAETSGAADRCHHITAMAERQQRKFNSKHVADRRFHGVLCSLRQHFLALLVVIRIFLNSGTTLAHDSQPSQALDADPASAIVIRKADDESRRGVRDISSAGDGG